MGMTLQQLEHTMTAQEFGQHYALEMVEPMPSAQWSMGAATLAALANGPLQPPEKGRLWSAKDFMPALWQPEPDPAPAPEAPMTIEQIMARARMAGMVQ